MNSHILTYIAQARQAFQHYASQTTDPATLIQLAEAHAALNRAVELWDAGAVTVHDGEASTSEHPDTIYVNDGRERYGVTVACPQHQVAWACHCDQTRRSYWGLCAHILAGHLLGVDAAHREELRQRRDRCRRMVAAESAYRIAVTERETLQVAYRHAEEHEAQTFARYCELRTQIQLDEQNAAMEQQTTPATSSEVAA